jgi:hypothetical protein
MTADLDMQCTVQYNTSVWLFGRVISTLLRNAQREGTVSAKNTNRSINEQTERPTAMMWMAYILLLTVSW